MKIQGKINDTDEVEVTLAITMTLKEWKALDEAIPAKYPFWKISSAITDAYFKIHKTINEEIEK